MTWVVADPKLVAISDVQAVSTALPGFPDEVPYEDIVDRATSKLGLLRDQLVVLTTDRGLMALQQLGSNAHIIGPKMVAKMAVDLAKERQIVVLRWQD